ncbi:hypothetical protein GJ496_003804 [Pomphorhynchus laevis]|nr:hypothetical protein GJ496_003804 [Pomphorhynchus laevis]
MPLLTPPCSIMSSKRDHNLYAVSNPPNQNWPAVFESSLSSSPMNNCSVSYIKNKSDCDMNILQANSNTSNNLGLLVVKPRPFSYAADNACLSEHITDCLSGRCRSGSDMKCNNLNNGKSCDTLDSSLNLSHKALQAINSNTELSSNSKIVDNLKDKHCNNLSIMQPLNHFTDSASNDIVLVATTDNEHGDNYRHSGLLSETLSDNQSSSLQKYHKQQQSSLSSRNIGSAIASSPMIDTQRSSSCNQQSNIIDNKDTISQQQQQECYSGSSNLAFPGVDYYSSGNHVSFIGANQHATNSTEKLCPYSSSSKLKPKSSTCVFLNMARFPWLSLCLGIFMIAEIIGFCVISSGFVSSSLSQIQRSILPNETFPVNQVRAFSSAVLSLVALLQVLAIICHMLIASAVARNQAMLIKKIEQSCRHAEHYPTHNTNGTSSHYSLYISDRFNSVSSNSKRQLLRYVCFRCIQLCLMLFFFLLFLLWLLISLMCFGLLVLGIAVPYIVFSCGQDSLPAILQDMSILKSNDVDYSSVQSIFMRMCLSTDGGGENCQAFQEMACSLRTEWTSTVPIMFGCCVFLVITIVLTLCCQSLNFGCSSHHMINKVKFAYLRTFQRNHRQKLGSFKETNIDDDDIIMKTITDKSVNDNTRLTGDSQLNGDCCVAGASNAAVGSGRSSCCISDSAHHKTTNGKICSDQQKCSDSSNAVLL